MYFIGTFSSFLFLFSILLQICSSSYFPSQLFTHRFLPFFLLIHFLRFLGSVIIRPDQFGVISQELPPHTALNLVAMSKVLRTLFMLSDEKSGPYTGMNEWIESKHER